jgi:hypothetical protein
VDRLSGVWSRFVEPDEVGEEVRFLAFGPSEASPGTRYLSTAALHPGSNAINLDNK